MTLAGSELNFDRKMFNINIDVAEYVRMCLVWLCVTFTVFSLGTQIKYYRKLPPGPWGLPILGNLHRILKGVPHTWYMQLCCKYGDLVSFRLGENLVICVGSAKLLRDLFNRQDSVGRPKTPLNNLLKGRGIMLSDGQLWRRQRQFLHEKLRALGVRFNDRSFQQIILLEVVEVIDILGRTGRSVDPAIILGRHIHNIITRLMMSFRFEENNPDFETFNENVSRGMKLYGSINIGEYLPWYLNLPGKMEVMREMERNLEDVSQFHLAHVMRRKAQRKTALTSEPADLLDYFLDELEKEEIGESKIFVGADPEKQIVQVMNDLFSAGMETARTVMVWLLLVMLREPEVAKKVRVELKKVVNPGDMVTLDHRSNLGYLEAVIYETMRRVSPVPLGTTHVNTKIWEVNGYIIPEGSHIIPLINKIHMDPIAFPEPEKFKPERFLQNGSVTIPENFIPFGVGRRLCLGDQLAKMEIFLLFANIMNSFEFALPLEKEMPNLDGYMATIHVPHTFELFFTKIQA